MFCTKCGKKIDYEAAVCNECAGMGQWFNTDNQAAPNTNNQAAPNTVNNSNAQEFNVNNNQPADNNGFYNDQNNNTYNNQGYNQGYANQGYNQGYNNQGYNNQGYNQGYNNNVYDQRPASGYNSEPEKPKGSRKEGLKGAITSAVLGFVGFIISYVVYAFATVSMYDVGDTGIAILIAIVPFMIASLVLGILAIPRGISAIKVFRSSNPKPIATLIVGIGGILFGASTLLMVFASVMMSFAAIIEML